MSWRGTIQQYAGRLHRLHAAKRVVEIYDYVDVGVPMLLAMHEKRLKGYKEIGYSVDGEATGLDTASQRRRHGRDAARR